MLRTCSCSSADPFHELPRPAIPRLVGTGRVTFLDDPGRPWTAQGVTSDRSCPHRAAAAGNTWRPLRSPWAPRPPSPPDRGRIRDVGDDRQRLTGHAPGGRLGPHPEGPHLARPRRRQGRGVAATAARWNPASCALSCSTSSRASRRASGCRFASARPSSEIRVTAGALATGSSSRLTSVSSNRAPATLSTRSTAPPRPGHRRLPRPTEPEAPSGAALPSRTPPTRPGIGEPGWGRRPGVAPELRYRVGGLTSRPATAGGRPPRSKGPVAQGGRLGLQVAKVPPWFPWGRGQHLSTLDKKPTHVWFRAFASACAHADARGSGCQSAASTTVSACQRI